MAETELPPQVEKFITFGVSEAFSALLTQFYQENCQVGVWENFTMDGEQTLERGACYQKYQQFVEEQLDSFCMAEGFSSAEVTQQIQQAKDDTRAMAQHEFLPSFLQNMDYDSFGRQMREQAKQMVKHAEAAAKAPSCRASFLEHAGDYASLPVDLSGVWKAHTNYQKQIGDNNKLEEFLQCLGCPWFARKILKYGSSFVKNVCINQTETGCSFTYNVLFFGTTTVEIVYGVDNNVPNLWQKMIWVHPVVDPVANNITEKSWGEDYFKGAGHYTYWQRMNRPEGDAPGDMLVLTESLLGVPDGLGGTKDTQFQQVFIREDALP